ncbi:MAG: phenylalanine--tRNA ligase subunit beta [Bacteriovoracia bacterium]
MLISLEWIKDFVAVPDMSPKELSERFTLTTAEVEGVIVSGAGMENVQIVQVLSKKPHPEADKLNLVTFETGKGPREVVCGASNVREGMKVFYAPIGTVLPSGLKLEPKKIRGILSDGMLCSSTELGLGAGVDGLMELPSDASIGMKLSEFTNSKADVVLEVDNKSLTHRPDLWGVFGQAREFAAAHQTPLKNPFDTAWEKKITGLIGSGNGPISFTVDHDSSAWAYLGLNIRGVKVGQSPDWLQRRLVAVGLRPINSVVDVSNYVMAELGMPNHIFDADRIAQNHLTIRRQKTDSAFKTLDGTERALIAHDTVIADSNGALVLAGIMGGESSGVTEATVNLFIEVANWDPAEVRKTSVRLGLRSDSSQRFEKTLDSHQCRRTLLRLVELLIQLHPEAKVAGGIQSWFREETLAKPVELKFTRSRITKVLGMDLSAERLVNYFKALDFSVEVQGENFTVVVPTFRTTKDISCVEDLIEEIGRMIGYDNIVPVSPLLPVRPVRLSAQKVLQRKVQDFMVLEARALEVMTYPLVGAELLKKASWPGDHNKLVLVNAISIEQDRMRPSLIPSALQVMAENQKHHSTFTFYEHGRAYMGYESERSCLLLGMYSREASRFVELLNHTEKLLHTLGLPFELQTKNDKFPNALVPYDWKGSHPHEFVNIRIQGKFHGAATTVHPLVMKDFKAKGYFSFVVIDLTDFEARESKDKTKYSHIPKFPSSSFDVSVTAKSDVPAGDVVKCLSSLKLKEMKSAHILGVYSFSEEEKSITLRIVFEDPNATLTSEFLSEAEKQVVQVLEKSGYPLRT